MKLKYALPVLKGLLWNIRELLKEVCFNIIATTTFSSMFPMILFCYQGVSGISTRLFFLFLWQNLRISYNSLSTGVVFSFIPFPNDQKPFINKSAVSASSLNTLDQRIIV